MFQKPFLKWVGGKTQILKNVMDKFPKEMNNYHEIFLGGGSVLLALLSREDIVIKGEIYAYDYNETLINLFRDVKENGVELFLLLKQIVKKYSSIHTQKGSREPKDINQAILSKESFYYWIRKQYNQEQESLNKSAMLLFLNKTCFRGLYRVGPNGFNVPYGHYNTPTFPTEEEMDNISRMISKVTFICSDFSDSLSRVDKGDFVYLDPPYAPETKKSFVSYTNCGFSNDSHEELFRLTKTLPCSFLMSNSCVDMVLNNFSEYSIDKIDVRRTINSKNPGKGTLEVLISK